MNRWIDRRRSAVLLHITSLPGPFHKGVLGKEAFEFIDALASGGFSVWQFLPLGPTHSHGSPYESLSTFAGNPELIDLRDCVASGWLDKSSIKDSTSAQQHAELRSEAGKRFWLAVEHDAALKAAVDLFKEKHTYWLEDYALFSALKNVTDDYAWWQWPEELRDRKAEALELARIAHQTLIQQIIFEQFLFERQWLTLKKYAQERDVLLFGDLPIYVAHDSADVWSQQTFFTVNEVGLCEEVAGVPPDYFSETGQRWGNPLYRWDQLQEDGFKWWIQRVSHQLERMHMLRIDHFLALEAFWAIPGASEDGIIGEWRKAPGRAMLQALQDNLGLLPLIAEDLGIITDEVTALRDDFGLPGMKILHFAFGGGNDNPYLPANHVENGVVYTGTHDNNTTMGCFEMVDEETREHMLCTLGGKAADMPWVMIEAALASPAKLAVIPMQDLLELGAEARFNTPGTLHGNWSWRLPSLPEPESACWQHADLLNTKHDR